MTDEKPIGLNVIHLFGPPPAAEGALEVKWSGSRCYPHWPIVDRALRSVTCKRCKANLDPIDILLEVARRHEEWTRLSAESSTMRREIEALKAEEKRVKARTKSASRKDAQTAVEAERERDGLRRQQTFDAAKEIAELSLRIQRLAMIGERKEFDGEGYWRRRARSAERQLQELRKGSGS